MSAQGNNPRKKWAAGLVLLLLAFFMYGSVMYRIMHYGAGPLP